METKKSPRKIWSVLSMICFILGIGAWIPNLVFNYGFGFWMLTFIINPIGIVFGIVGRSRFGIIVNIIMTFSFFIFMFVGYLIAGISGGKP